MRTAIVLVVFTALLVASAVVAQGAPLSTRGGGGASASTLDGAYLRLDAANDPVTGNLDVVTPTGASAVSRLRVGPASASPSNLERGTITLGKGIGAESCLNFLNNSVDNDPDDAIGQICLDANEVLVIKPERVGSALQGFADALGDLILAVDSFNQEVEFYDGTNYASVKHLGIKPDGALGTHFTGAADLSFLSGGVIKTLGNLQPTVDGGGSLGNTTAGYSRVHTSTPDCATLTCDASNRGMIATCDDANAGKPDKLVFCAEQGAGTYGFHGVDGAGAVF